MAIGVKRQKVVQETAWEMGGQQATIRALPQTVMLNIFRFLSAPDAAAKRPVCREWKTLLDADSLWNFFRKRDFGCLEKVERPAEDYRRLCALPAGPIEELPIVREFQELSDELKFKIFGCLHSRNAFMARLVCGDWNRLLRDTRLWESYLRQDFGFKGETKKRPLEQLYLECFMASVIAKGMYFEKRILEPSDDQDCIPPPNCITPSLRYLAIPKDSKTLISVSCNGTIKIYDLESLKCGKVFRNGEIAPGVDHICSIAATKGGDLILGGSSDGSIYILDLEKGALKTTLKTGSLTVSSLTLTKDEKRLISISVFCSIQVWDLATGHCEMTIQAPKDRIAHAILSKDEKKLISGDVKGTIAVWDLESGTCEKTMQLVEKGIIHLLAFTDDGDLIVGFRNGKIHICDLEERICKKILDLKGPKDFRLIKSLANGKLMTASCQLTPIANEVSIWDLETGVCEKTFELPFKRRSVPDLNLILTKRGELISSSPLEIRIFDFTTSFEELAKMFEDHDLQEQRRAMRMFLKMPKEEREKVYGELSELLKLTQSECMGCGEDVFHNRNGLHSSPQQKAQAIRNYLDQRNRQAETTQ